MPIVEKMLELAELGPNEFLYDLASGDGRIVIMAAQRYGARAVGIDYDPKLCHLARTTIQQLGLSGQARIIENDILEEDWSPADVVTI